MASGRMLCFVCAVRNVTTDRVFLSRSIRTSYPRDDLGPTRNQDVLTCQIRRSYVRVGVRMCPLGRPIMHARDVVSEPPSPQTSKFSICLPPPR